MESSFLSTPTSLIYLFKESKLLLTGVLTDIDLLPIHEDKLGYVHFASIRTVSYGCSFGLALFPHGPQAVALHDSTVFQFP